eukprot:1287796-Rhodomonas_salina.4
MWAVPVPYRAAGPISCYAVSGTDVGYAGTRCPACCFNIHSMHCEVSGTCTAAARVLSKIPKVQYPDSATYITTVQYPESATSRPSMDLRIHARNIHTHSLHS